MSQNFVFVSDPGTFGASGSGTGGAQQLVGFTVGELFSIVDNATRSAQAKLQEIKSRRSAISIGDMFEMQMLMNHLSQLSEMATSVVSASQSAIMDMARNVKG
jgi:hypothetical protein